MIVLTSSGTGAMESAVANLVRPGQPILACAGGKFGERWLELGEAFGADVLAHEPEWGARIDPADPRRRSTHTRVSRPARTAPSSSSTTTLASAIANSLEGVSVSRTPPDSSTKARQTTSSIMVFEESLVAVMGVSVR